MLTLGTAAVMLCTDPSIQHRQEGAAENKGCWHCSVQPYGRLILSLALSSMITLFVIGLSQPTSRVACQLTLWQKDQLQQLGSSMSCNQAQTKIVSRNPVTERWFPVCW